MTSRRLPSVSCPARTWRTPMISAAAHPTAMTTPTSRSNTPWSADTSISRLTRLVDWSTNRPSSRSSRPNAFTTRTAASTSCTTPIAELSSFLISFQSLRKRGPNPRDSANSSGLTETATIARPGLMRAVTQIIATTVVADPTSGMRPSTTTRWMAGASYGTAGGVGVGRTCRVVVRQRQPLDVPKQVRAEILGQLLARVRPQEFRGHVDQRPRDSREHQDRPGQGEERRRRLDQAVGGDAQHPARQRPRTQHRVDRDLDRQRPEQRERRGQQLQDEHQQDVRPVGARVGGKAADERQLWGIGICGHATINGRPSVPIVYS